MRPITRLEVWIGDQGCSILESGNESLLEETIDYFIRGGEDDSGRIEKSEYHVRLTSTYEAQSGVRISAYQ